MIIPRYPIAELTPHLLQSHILQEGLGDSLGLRGFFAASGHFTFTEWFAYAGLDGSEYGLCKKLQDASVVTTATLFGTSSAEDPYAETPEAVEFETECVELGPVDVVLEVAWDGSGPAFRADS